MKSAIIAGFVLILLIASPVLAETPGDDCSVGKVDISAEYGETAHVKMIYRFTCNGDYGSSGQVTKMLITLPLTDVNNVKASDAFGSMDVLEGPEYVKATTGSDGTKIGVIFRRGLLVSEDEARYDVAIEFDTDALVDKAEDTYSVKPGLLKANPKVTIVTSGLTETVMPVSLFDFSLDLKEGASVTQVKPAVCGIDASDVECDSLSGEQLESLEIKWTGGGTGWGDKIQGYTEKYLPTVKNFFGGLVEKVKGIFNR